MAIGGYTTAILMDRTTASSCSATSSGATCATSARSRSPGSSPGSSASSSAFPALRLSGLYLALATFAIAVATPAMVKRFDAFTGGGGGINLFGDRPS